MGLLCCKPEAPQQIQLDLKQQAQSNRESFYLNMIQNIDKMAGVDLSSIIDDELIEQFYSEIQSTIESPSLKKTSLLLLDYEIPLLKNQLMVWMKFQKQENTQNKLHLSYSETNIPFTPELIYLYLLSINKTNFSKLYKNLEAYEIVNQTIKDDHLFILYRYLTKKQLYVGHRNYFVFRILRKNPDGTISEFQTSVNTSKLLKLKEFKGFSVNFNDMAIIYANGSEFEKTSKGYVWKQFSKKDILSDENILNLKPMIKKEMKTYYSNMMKQIVHFLLKTPDLDDLLWFGDNHDKRRIIDENLKILSKSDINIQNLSSDTQNLFISKFSWKKKKASNISKHDEQVYESVETLNDNKDKYLINLDNKFDNQTKELKKRLENLKNDSFNQSFGEIQDSSLQKKIAEKIDKMAVAIDKRSSVTREILENSINEGSFVEDIERKLNNDYKKLGRDVDKKMKKVMRKSIGRKNNDDSLLVEEETLYQRIMKEKLKDYEKQQVDRRKNTEELSRSIIMDMFNEAVNRLEPKAQSVDEKPKNQKQDPPAPIPSFSRTKDYDE